MNHRHFHRRRIFLRLFRHLRYRRLLPIRYQVLDLVEIVGGVELRVLGSFLSMRFRRVFASTLPTLCRLEGFRSRRLYL